MSERSFRRDYQRRLEGARRRQQLRVRKAAAAVGAAGAFALAAPAMAAADQVVLNNNDSGAGSLRDAIAAAAANPGPDTITFDSTLTGSTIALTSGPLVVNDSNPLTITGLGRDNLTVSGGGTQQVFDVQATYDAPGGLTISGLTITDGNAPIGGGLYAHGGPGPGLYSYVDLTDVAVTNSTATGDSFTAGPFGDEYLSGGGIANFGSMRITNSTISGNTSSTTTSTPEAYFYGGGGIDNLGQLTITGSTISGNDANTQGGGIFQGTKYRASLDISNSTITGNGAPIGGGVAEFGRTKYGASVNQISNSTISGNDAYAGGGVGLKYVGGNDRWTITHSTLSGNSANSGGAMLDKYVLGTAQLVDSTISGNTANGGAGVYLAAGAQKYADAVQFNNSTVASNGAGSYGGGFAIAAYGPGPGNVQANTDLTSTIVADNTANGAPDDFDMENPTVSGINLSFSLVEAPGNAIFNQVPPGSNILGVDPQLGGLANNGGPTLTQLPAVTSPVVDKGNAPGMLTTDQRGDPRTVDTGPSNASDGTDIGAVELASAPGAGGTKVHGVKKKHKKRKRVLRTKHPRVKVHVTFSSSTPGVTFKCSVDGGPARSCTSPFSPMVSSAPGKGKVHTVTITAYDSAGNVVGKPRTFRFRIIREG